MRHPLRTLAVGLVGLATAAGTLAATGAPAEAAGHSGGNGGQTVLSAALAPSVPSDPAVFGVAAGSVPWVLHAGHAVLGRDGRLQVTVAGLIDPQKGTNPVPYLAASVYCSGTLAATTAPVPFPPSGNARIHADVDLPSFCPAPAVLLNPAPHQTVATGVYIGFTGAAPPYTS